LPEDDAASAAADSPLLSLFLPPSFGSLVDIFRGMLFLPYLCYFARFEIFLENNWLKIHGLY
jgi:hypothetical protein